MAGAELSDQFRRVFGRVDGEGFWDDEEGLSEFADGELFSGALLGEILVNERGFMS